jgi:hypothetical protein
MQRGVVLMTTLAVIVALATPVWAQQPPKKTDPKPPQLSYPDYAGGVVQAVGTGTPLVITVKATDVSDKVRPMKGEGGRLTVELAQAVLREGGVPRVGDTVLLFGIVQNGKFVVRSMTLQRK